MTRKQRRAPRFTMPPPPRITVSEANDLGADLILELTEDAGNPQAVGATLTRWLDREGDVFRLSLICMAALKATYADRLTRVHVDDLEHGDLTLIPTTERTSK